VTLCSKKRKSDFRLTTVVNKKFLEYSQEDGKKIVSSPCTLFDRRGEGYLFCGNTQENPQLLAKKTVRKVVSIQIPQEFRKHFSIRPKVK